MIKLSAADAGYLYGETINTPQHVGGIQYVKVPATQKPHYFEKLRTIMLDRVHLLPYLTNRLQPMPDDIDHPVWVRDTDFNIDNHLHRIEVDAPGTHEQLEALCAQLYEPLLDRAKPLWEMWVIEGLDHDQIAILSKTHHACLDGMAGVAVSEILGDDKPMPRKVESADKNFWQAEDTSAAALMRESWSNLTKYWIDSWAMAPARNAASARAYQRQVQEAAQRPMLAPKAPWNAAIDGQRSLAGAHFSLSTLRSIGKATGTKINDVILAIAADALNRYLARKDVKLDGPLIAGCPVSLRKAGDQTMNNQVGFMAVSLENDIEDPVRRLSSIHGASRAAKEMLAEFEDALQADYGVPYLPAQLQALTSANIAGDYANEGTHVPTSLVISNVAGLTTPLYMAGGEVVGTTPLSIVGHGGGLNVTVSSYVDRMDLGLTASTRVVPDVASLRDDFIAAYEDLVTTVLDSASRTDIDPVPDIATATINETVDEFVVSKAA